MRITKKLPSWANVQAGSTATLDFPLGLTYDKVLILYAGVTLAQMQHIDLKINGKSILEYKNGDQLQSINKYYNRHTQAGILVFHFNRPEMSTLEHERITGLGTADVQTMQLSMDIDAAAAAPLLTASAVVSDPQNLGLFVKVKSFGFSSATSGEFEIDNIPKGPKVLAMHLFKVDVDNLEVEIDSRKVTDATKTILGALQYQSGRVPQSAIATHIDYGLEGDILQALSTSYGNGKLVQDFRLRAELTTGGSMDVLVEYVDGYNGI